MINYIYTLRSEFNKIFYLAFSAVTISLVAPSVSSAQHDPEAHIGMKTEMPATVNFKEEDFYRMITLPIPEEINLEVGGLALMPGGDLAAATRRGEVWIIENPYMENGTPYFRRFASGLHEALGLEYTDNALFTAQRGELTCLRDTDGDGKADSYKSVSALPVSGNYHEYSHGPVLLPDGNFLVTLNLAHRGEEFFGEMNSLTKWRGWAVKITPDGKLIPIAPGLRSPAGVGLNAEGDMFYTENQGGWVGSGYLSHIVPGAFYGHPAGLLSSHLPGSTVTLKPKDIPNTGQPFPEITKTIPGFKRPSVWLPHGIMGNSNAEVIADKTSGQFGPFANQLFIGDQAHAKIMRVALEKVKGEYQGACFPFREGFASGVLRLEWGKDGSLFAGMTDRGWSSTGPKRFGIQRLVWTGKVPFEIKNMIAKPDGFELEFTLPVDKATAGNIESYFIKGFTYKYHESYGSPVVEIKNCEILAALVSEDGKKVRLVVDGLREGYIHEIKAEGVKAAAGMNLLHNFGYYTLNNLPEGKGLDKGSLPKKSPKTTSSTIKEKPSSAAKTASVMLNKRQTVMPASWTNGPDKSITIGTKPGLKFDITSFEVKAGSKVKLVFNDNDDMQHNLVVVEPGSAEQVGTLALKLGLDGAEMNYVPKTNKVLFHTKLLQPNSSEAIYFVAPEKPGDYTYVCTYPGHYVVMQGTMKVLSK